MVGRKDFWIISGLSQIVIIYNKYEGYHVKLNSG